MSYWTWGGEVNLGWLIEQPGLLSSSTSLHIFFKVQKFKPLQRNKHTKCVQSSANWPFFFFWWLIWYFSQREAFTGVGVHDYRLMMPWFTACLLLRMLIFSLHANQGSSFRVFLSNAAAVFLSPASLITEYVIGNQISLISPISFSIVSANGNLDLFSMT